MFDPHGVWLSGVTMLDVLNVVEVEDGHILRTEVDDVEVEYVRVCQLVEP